MVVPRVATMKAPDVPVPAAVLAPYRLSPAKPALTVYEPADCVISSEVVATPLPSVLAVIVCEPTVKVTGRPATGRAWSSGPASEPLAWKGTGTPQSVDLGSPAETVGGTLATGTEKSRVVALPTASVTVTWPERGALPMLSAKV